MSKSKPVKIDPHTVVFEQVDWQAKIEIVLSVFQEKGAIATEDVCDAVGLLPTHELFEPLIGYLDGIGVKLSTETEGEQADPVDDVPDEKIEASSGSDAGADPVRMYMREMGRHNLLNREEEIQIAILLAYCAVPAFKLDPSLVKPGTKSIKRRH